jgi:hypothetical protein
VGLRRHLAFALPDAGENGYLENVRPRKFSLETLEFLRRKGSEGGKKAAASLTPEQRTTRARAAALSGTAEERSERARKAVAARESKRKRRRLKQEPLRKNHDANVASDRLNGAGA